MLCIFKSLTKTENSSLTEQEQLLDEVLKAKEDWELSILHFNEATEPEVIEYVSYQIKAAEKKYIYLLNLYKAQYSLEKEKENFNIATN